MVRTRVGRPGLSPPFLVETTKPNLAVGLCCLGVSSVGQRATFLHSPASWSHENGSIVTPVRPLAATATLVGV